MILPTPSRPTLTVVTLLLALACTETLAHGIDLQTNAVLTPEGWIIEGQLRYTDDSSAAGDYVQVEPLTDPASSTLALQTDSKGHFRLPALADQRYRISIDGDEGHGIETEVVTSKQTLDTENHHGGAPVYLVIGSLLLLSLIPAHFMKVKTRQ